MDWLMKILGMQQGGGMPFGTLGGTGPTGAAVPGTPMGPPVPGTPGAGGVNGGMPMSGAGPGAPIPGAPGSLLAGAPLNLSPGGGNPGLWQGQPGQGQGQSGAMNTAMNLIKGPQLQPAPWMQMMPMGTMRG